MKKAFTLIELIFVIVMIGILAAVAIPKFNDTREDAISKSIKQDVNTIQKAIKSYYMVQGDITDISDAVEVNGDRWILDTTKLILEYKISGTTCVEIEVDKTSSHTLKTTITPSSHTLCQSISDDGVTNSSAILY